MSVSNFSAAQREQQQQNLKKFLALSFLASAVLHGVVLPFSLNFVKAAEAEEESIEFVVVEEPETKAVEPEPSAEKEVAPPPEPTKTETAEAIPKEEPMPQTLPTPKEEPVVETPPPPTSKEEPVMPPKEEPVMPPKEEPVAQTPLTPKEEPIISRREDPVIPPKEDPVIPPKEDLSETPKTPTESPFSPPADTSADTSREPPETDNSNPPPATSPPPPEEPPVTAYRPGGGGQSTDFMGDGAKPNTSENLGGSESNSSPARGSDIGEPLSEPFRDNSAPTDRPPAGDPPVTAYRPGGGSTSSGSGDTLSDLVNPSSPDIPGGDSSGENNWNSSSGGSGNGDGIGSSEPFGDNSGAMDRAPRNTDGPVSSYRPGGGSSSGGGFPDLGDPGSSGVPGGDGGGGNSWNSSSGGTGNGDGIDSSEPFGSGGLGAIPKPGGGSGGPSPGSGGTPGVCVRCNKPAYPIAARRQKREGLVELLVNIDADGNVMDVSVATSSGHEDLDQAAINGVRNWKFSSAEGGVQGKLVTVRFELDD